MNFILFLVSGIIFFTTLFLLYLKYRYKCKLLRSYFLTILIYIICLLSLLIFMLFLSLDVPAFVLVMLLVLIVSQKHLILNILLAIPTVLLFIDQPTIHFSNIVIYIYKMGTLLYSIIAVCLDFNQYRIKIKKNSKYKRELIYYWSNGQLFKLFKMFISNHFSSYKHHIL